MEEWKEYKLKDVTSVLGDGIHGTPKYDENGAVFFINGNNLENGKIIIKENTRRVSVEESIKHRKPLTDRTILVSINGTLGNVARYNGEPCILGKSACYFNVKEEFDLIFIYYVVANGEFRKDIERLATGTTIKNVSLETMRNYTFYAPSLKTQKQIASILKSLDDKIEVNRKINENLEQQAQALFKSWFVDFEPFKDGEFVESELGMIPKGWRVGTVNDVCCFESGFAFKSTTYKQEGEYRLITIKNVQDGYLDVNGSVCLDELPAKMPQYCLLRIGDILLSLTGNVGRCCFVDEERLLLNQRVAKLKPRIKNNWGYIYTLFRNPSFKDRVVSIARGTAQANLSPIETSNMKIIIPIDKVLEDFSAIVDESYRIMINNMIESRRLAELRDTLLPKLMSGELNVFDKPNDQS